jgi:MerR family transcriptional regulator, heat shock protein HspR
MTHPDHDARPAPNRGVYGISVAAELCGAPVQSLRLWERHGLLTPARSQGGTRRYSADDLTRLHRIIALAAAGINIAGISRILDLEDDNAMLRTANIDPPSADDILVPDGFTQALGAPSGSARNSS